MNNVDTERGHYGVSWFNEHKFLPYVRPEISAYQKMQYDEAKEALVRSLELRPDAATVLLSLALLYEKQEKWAGARELISQISVLINELPPADQTRLSALQQRLDDRR